MPNPLAQVKRDAGYMLATGGTSPLRDDEHLPRLAMEGISSWAGTVATAAMILPVNAPVGGSG